MSGNDKAIDRQGYLSTIAGTSVLALQVKFLLRSQYSCMRKIPLQEWLKRWLAKRRRCLQRRRF